MFHRTAIKLQLNFRAPFVDKQKSITTVPLYVFFFLSVCGSSVWPGSWEHVSVEALAAPDMMMVLLLKMWGVGGFRSYRSGFV